MDGMAVLRAQILDTELTPLVVWDRRSGEEPEGTHSLVQHWRSHGRWADEVVDMAKLLSEVGIKPALVEATMQSDSPQIGAMLFADAVGYPRLTEGQLLLLTPYVLDSIDKITARFEGKWLSKRAGGDGLFMVFPSVAEAGNFALELRDEFRNVEWVKVALPRSLGVRIALDAGPVYAYTGPAAQRPEFYDWQVNRAARIEPITLSGQVYASQSFAALAVAQGVTEFTCDYVGQVPLAKGPGTFPMYHVRRRNEPE
jgi:class 3 adenylate cyclase